MQSQAPLDGEAEPPVGQAASPAEKREILKLDTSFSVWLILFVFGGGLLALYYGGIGYFPQVSWQDSLTYLAMMTIIGGSLLVAYSFLLFIPGAIWSQFLISDATLDQVLKMKTRPWAPCVLSVAKSILLPFTLFMVFCHFLLYEEGRPLFTVLGAAASLTAVSILLARDLREGLERAAIVQDCSELPSTGAVARTLLRPRLGVGASHALLFAAFIATASHYSVNHIALWIAGLFPFAAAVSLLVSEVESWRRQRGSERQNPNANLPPGTVVSVPKQYQVADKKSLLCRWILAFDCAALLSFAALWFFHRLYRGETFVEFRPSEIPLLLLLLCTLVVIVTNLSVSVLLQEHRRWAFMASFLAALLLLGAGQLLPKTESTLPAKIMATFGFGGREGTLVLTKKGGRILCQYAIPVEFEKRQPVEESLAGLGHPAAVSETPGGSSEKRGEGKRVEETLARTAHVAILSRLGSEYVILVNEQKIALPKEDVVSWSTKATDAKVPQIPDDCWAFIEQERLPGGGTPRGRGGQSAP
jgi:hypothetical protein